MNTILKPGGNPKPTANLTINKNRVKVYNNDTYFLQDGQTFEIELFNPTQDKVRADITLDGRNITESGLVINPGQRVYLERFVDSNNKFLFETYEVEDTDEVKEAISKNGKMKVEFYKETSQPYKLWGTKTITWQNPGFNHWDNVWYSGNGTYLNGDGTYTTHYIGNDGNSSDMTLTTTTVNNTNTSSGLYNHNVNFVHENALNNMKKSVENDKKSETGRVEKGEASEQTFETVHGDFQFIPFESVEYNILPLSKKPLTKKDVTYKRYCHECGSKVKSKFKFCPSCGEKL